MDVFFDIGCARGRTLMMASLHEFKRVVGVEFDAELVKVAETNVSRFQARQSEPRQIEVVCHDASKDDFPDENSIIYFFNPIKECVMAKALDNICRSARQTKERTIIQHIPKHESLLSDLTKFTLITRTRTCAVYRMVF